MPGVDKELELARARVKALEAQKAGGPPPGVDPEQWAKIQRTTNIVVAVILMLCVAGCVTMCMSPSEESKARSVIGEREVEARVLIASRLKDPGSARFEDIWVQRDDRAVCGRVNAKNAFGGYAGAQRFVVSPNDDVLLEEAGGDGFLVEWLAYCAPREPMEP